MKFPKRIFAKWAQQHTQLPILIVAGDCIELADETDGVIPVAVYELVSTGKLATRSTFLADKAKGRRS